MKQIYAILISILIVFGLTGCKLFQQNDSLEDVIQSALTTANENWPAVISENDLPTSIPVFRGDGEVRFDYDTITVHNDDILTFDNYISNLNLSSDWELMKEITETHYVYYNEEELLILDITFELEALDGEPGMSEATVIEFVTGETAKFRASTYN